MFDCQEIHVGLWGKMVRVVCVRMRPRASKSNEVLTDGILDRDFGISLLLFEGLSRVKQESWHGFAVQCLALEV